MIQVLTTNEIDLLKIYHIKRLFRLWELHVRR